MSMVTTGLQIATVLAIGLLQINISGRLTKKYVLRYHDVSPEASEEDVQRLLERSLRGPSHSLVRVPKWYSVLNLLGWAFLGIGLLLFGFKFGWWVIVAGFVTLLLVFLLP